MNAFSDVDCMGVSVDGRVIFLNIEVSEKCKFSQTQYQINGVLWYSFESAVGYDDLYDETVHGIKRYGRNWNLECRIKAQDTLWVEPGAEGNRVEEDFIFETDIKFDLNMFYDDDFLQPYNGSVDIGIESLEDQRVYIRASSQYLNDEALPFMLHIKSCFAKTYQILPDGSEVLMTVATDGPGYDVREMITDGCRADNPFASRNIQIKGSRTEWNNDEVLTLSNDQFQVDLWNPVGNTADNVIIYRFECTAVACEKDAFLTHNQNSVCKLNQDICPNRYDNLFQPSTRNSKTQYSRTQVFTFGDSITVNMKEGKSGSLQIISNMFIFSMLSVL